MTLRKLQPLNCRSRSWMLASALIVCTCGCTRSPNESPPNLSMDVPTTDEAPKFVDKEFRQLGPVFADETPSIECEFKVQNDGTTVLRVVKTVPSCGCASGGVEPEEIHAGESGTLRLEMRVGSHGKRMPKAIACDVVFEDGSVWRYGFQVEVFPTIEIEPPDLFFGRLTVESPEARTVTAHLFSRSGEPGYSLETARDDIPAITVSENCRSKARAAAPGVEETVQTFQVRLTPSRDSSVTRSEVHLTFSNGNETRDVRVPAIWTIPSLYKLEPARAFFGIVSAAESKGPIEVRISRVDGRPFGLRSPTPSVKGLTVAVHGDEVCTEHTVSVGLDAANGLTHAVFGDIEIPTDQADQPTVRIAAAAIPRTAQSAPRAAEPASAPGPAPVDSDESEVEPSQEQD